MRVHITQLEYWKSEHDATTNEDSLKFDADKGLFAVADGVGTASFANIWSRILVNRFVKEPLMSEHPFEVEWWVRRAQDEYVQNKQTRPEAVPDFAKEKAREGSRSTLATIRFTEADDARAEAILLAVGDSDIFIARNGTSEIKAFPLEKASEFDARPIILPTRLIEFDRAFHRCQIRREELHVGDTLILATDAVSKWILSQPNPREAFEQVSSIRPGEGWKDFIESCRKEDTIVDDDSTALVIKLTNSAEDSLFGITKTYGDQTITERKAALENYKGDPEKLAICFGDGKWLPKDGIPGDDIIKNARLVADAMKDVRLALSSAVKTGKLSTAWKAWDKHRSLLMDKPWAATLSKSLTVMGIPLEGPMPPEELPKPPEPIKPAELSRQVETAKVGKPITSPSGTTALSVLPSRSAAGTAEGRREPSNVAAADTPGLPPDESIRSQLNQFRLALGSNRRKIESMHDAEGIAKIYQESLDRFLTTPETNFGRDARRIVELTKRVRDAIRADKDELILSAYSHPEIDQDWLFGSLEWDRIQLARLRKSLAEGDDDQSVKIADETIKTPGYLRNNLTKEQSKRLDDAHERISKFLRFQTAFRHDDDEEVRSAYDDVLKEYKKFTTDHRQRYELACQRLDALVKFRRAYATRKDEKIVEAYNSALLDRNLTKEERARAESALERVRALEKLLTALGSSNEFEITRAADPRLLAATRLSSADHEKIGYAFWKIGWLWQAIDWANHDNITEIGNRFSSLPKDRQEMLLQFWQKLLDDKVFKDRLSEEQCQLLRQVHDEGPKAKRKNWLGR